MEWNMLNESKKLFPHWLDKSDNSNFTKHLKILNAQQKDIRHKLKCIDWSRVLNKPLQIHKTQTEPYKWKVEFEVNVPRLKEVNIYKNPTIVDNHVVNSAIVIDGYYEDGNFYESKSTFLTSLSKEVSSDEGVYQEPEFELSNRYMNWIQGVEDKYYHDISNNKYYKYLNNKFEEINVAEVPQTSLIHSESFIDNYSHFFRYIHYDDNVSENLVNKFVDDNGDYKYKEIWELDNTENNGKYELTFSLDDDFVLYYNENIGKYYAYNKNKEFVEIDNNQIIWLDCETNQITRKDGSKLDKYSYYYTENNQKIIKYSYYYIENECVEEVPFEKDNNYYICVDNNKNKLLQKIPLIETENITPIISNDKYVLEVYTWDDYHFLKGFPEIDFIDYNNNNIIDVNERTYDNLSINIEKINDKEYLTFRVHQYGIKLIEIFKDDKLIHKADFVIENMLHNYNYKDDVFAYIYNYNDNELYSPFKSDVEAVDLDVDEYVWRYEISKKDKIYDNNDNFELKNNFDLKVTYNDVSYSNSDEDKILTKRYVCEDSIFYHDISLDMIGALYNVPRHVFVQPTSFEDKESELDFYSKTYPQFCNNLNEDDYHYQKRLEYYINNYNKIYFPVLEFWKYFHINSELINRKVIISEQNYSYMRNLNSYENKYINELSENKFDSFYLNYNPEFEVGLNLQKPIIKSHISPEDYVNSINGYLVDDDNKYIRDIYNNLIRNDYDYYINSDGKYVVKYEEAHKKFQWYVSEIDSNANDEIYQIKLTNSLKIVPNTRYQLRFCVKKYPKPSLNLKLIYKNNNDDVREVEETTPLRKDYDELNEYNELNYSDYNKEWGISCEYICTDFITPSTAQNIEICLESLSSFAISDITLQRVTINHFDSEYMRTDTDYNSCVYDLYADYNEIPSNIRYIYDDDLSIFNKVLNRSLPITKKGFFNFVCSNTDASEDLELSTETNIYWDNLLDVESKILPQKDNYSNIYEKTYDFKKYIKKGEYEILIIPYRVVENNIISDFKIDITMLVFDEDNSAHYENISLDEFGEYKIKDNNGNFYYRIPFENKSDNSLKIKVYSTNKFSFSNFKLIRKFALTNEEMIK